MGPEAGVGKAELMGRARGQLGQPLEQPFRQMGTGDGGCCDRRPVFARSWQSVNKNGKCQKNLSVRRNKTKKPGQKTHSSAAGGGVSRNIKPSTKAQRKNTTSKGTRGVTLERLSLRSPISLESLSTKKRVEKNKTNERRERVQTSTQGKP